MIHCELTILCSSYIVSHILRFPEHIVHVLVKGRKFEILS